MYRNIENIPDHSQKLVTTQIEETSFGSFPIYHVSSLHTSIEFADEVKVIDMVIESPRVY